ncbi:MAG: SMC-Scp complex subunit ScpB [Candidatus Polarisedimenticolia bacterium]
MPDEPRSPDVAAPRPPRARRAGGAARPPVEIPEAPRLRAIVEALAFAAEEPLTLQELVELFPGTPEDQLTGILDGLERTWEAPDRGLRLLRVAGGVRLTTRPDLGEWVRALFRSRNRRRLSTQALETLAIVAYRQPITTPEIQAIRGSDPGAVLEGLLEKKLVRILGRKKVVGKPVLYGTTQEFLAHFGLDSLDELPGPEEFGGLAAGGGAGAVPGTARIDPAAGEDGGLPADDHGNHEDEGEVERDDA